MSQIDLTAFFLTLKLAFITTFLLYLAGIPISYYIAYSKSKFAFLLEALCSLPLVLPPTVLGFYLLLLLSKEGPIGSVWYKLFDRQLVFHFEGIVVSSFIYSLPMMVHPLSAGFRSVPKSLIEASLSLGKGPVYTLLRVVLPNMKASLLTGGVLSFAHTMGEFGVVLMVGGNIEGETRVVSIAIYDAVEKIDYTTAHVYSALLLLLAFLSLAMLYAINRRWSF